eukprot:scaffold9195_cov69-Cyclotella_meneghiniana.AAC.6
MYPGTTAGGICAERKDVAGLCKKYSSKFLQVPTPLLCIQYHCQQPPRIANKAMTLLGCEVKYICENIVRRSAPCEV